jgi:hypothetical protein
MRWHVIAIALVCASCEKPAQVASTGSGGVIVAQRDAASLPEPELPDEEAAKALADKACPRVVAPYFYRVEKAGKVSHILGTRHMSVSLDKMPPPVKQTLANAKLVVFETAPGDDGESEPVEGSSLAERLGPQLWAKYQALVGTSTAAMVEHAPPAAAMVMMLLLFEHQQAQLDEEIERAVLAKDIPTGGLEAAAFQDQLLTELLDLKMLKASIAGTPDRATLQRDSIEDITEYCAGTDNDPGMDARTRAVLKAGGFTDAELAKQDDKLLFQRNDNWMPKLERLFAKGDVFVVVGADHLIGTRGVIAMLAARGFATTRVTP